MARALGRELFFFLIYQEHAVCHAMWSIFVAKHDVFNLNIIYYFIMKTLAQKAKATFILSRFGFFLFLS